MNQTPEVKNSMIIRTVVLIVALLNQSLVNFGYSPLPFDDQWVETAVTSVLIIAAALVAWWKDNDITRKARRRKQLAEQKGLK